MATRSTIAMKTDTGYAYIYCHYDGYLDHNGAILSEHYTTEEKVKALINLGHLSYLRENVCNLLDQAHSWDNPASNVCLAYHRDRGEPLVIDNVANFDDIKTQEYNYVWEDGCWHLWKKHDSYWLSRKI